MEEIKKERINYEPIIAGALLKFESLDNIKNYNFMVSFSLNKRNRWNLSFRSTTDDVDVSKIAATFGGGGHRRAAGASGLAELPEFLRVGIREWTKFN